MKLEVKKNVKAFNEFTFNGKCTAGALLCIMHALQEYEEKSPLAQEVLDEFARACRITGDERLNL